jgi:hypothetical protein
MHSATVAGMADHDFTDDNLANGWPADFMCGCAKGDLLGPCEHSPDRADIRYAMADDLRRMGLMGAPE